MAMRNKRALGWLLCAGVCSACVMLVAQVDAVGWPSAGGDSGDRPGASRSWAPPEPDADDPALDDDGEPGEEGLRELTPEEISRIRFMELRGMRLKTSQPDRVKTEVPRETVERFLAEMADDPQFRDDDYPFRSKKNQKEFRKLTSAQKVHWIAHYSQTKFADEIKIKSDPEVFVTFKKNVLPIIVRTCAKQPGCHASTGEDESIRFRLFEGARRPAPRLYANFLVLNDTEVGDLAVIDRSQPSDSLLLTYLLPAETTKAAARHPGTDTFKPPFKSRKAPGFRRIEQWIRSLKHPAEDYGVRLVPMLGGGDVGLLDEDETDAATGDGGRLAGNDEPKKDHKRGARP